MDSFRILVADDHPVFRFGLCSLLRSHESWEVCGEATDGRDAVEKYRELRPDLVIFDVAMTQLNGVDAARQILKHNSEQRVLVLTSVESEHVIRDCVAAGVRGWIFKSEGTKDLVCAVEAMQQHRSTFSARVSTLILDGYLQRSGIRSPAPKTPSLTPREREVVQLLGEGRVSKEVAVMLNISVKTTETHRSNIMRKLKLHSVAELVLYAVKNEIVHVHIPAQRFPHPGDGQVNMAS